MSTFNDSDELYEIQGGFFEHITSDPKLGPKFMNSNTSFLVRYKNPDGNILIDCTGSEPEVTYPVDADSQAQITLDMDADAGHQFWLGKLNLTGAIARRKVQIGGSMKDAMKLLPAMKPAFPKYRAYCESNGHADKIGG